jgi:hypothetical protein
MTRRDASKRLTPSFAALLRERYGVGPSSYASLQLRADKLVAGYYGVPRNGARGCAGAKPKSAISFSFDDGEVLTSSGQRLGFTEYVVEHSPPTPVGEEYVVQARGLSVPSAEGAAPPLRRSSHIADECETDILDPLAPAPPSPSRSLQEAPTAPARPTRATPRERSAQPPSESRSLAVNGSSVAAANPPSQRTPPAMAVPEAGDHVSPVTPSDDDFMKDLQQILSGEKVFDARTRTTMPRDQLERPSPAAVPASSDKSSAIFDQIARSMEYSNAYDLGTIELENRFADFDRQSDQAKRKKTVQRPAPVQTPSASEGDFQRDLAEIKQQTAYSQSVAPAYSRPLYDTGEHVLMGADQYVDQLRVGPSPGVAFSYGQLISMADFYESVDQMMAADLGELGQLKTLIARSASHYGGGGGADVSNDEWERVTRKRYLQLAEKNYEHFSPNLLTFSPAALKAKAFGDNKGAWQSHHRWAIEAMQKLFLESGNVSVFPEWPLILNAFGDHFLTDAFAAGHLVNKEAIIEVFKANFFSGGTLTSAANDFFGKVADAAYVGPVKAKFSELETVEWYRILGVPIFHPNITSAERFAKVLQGVAEKAPEQIGNLAVKAIHDRLNRDGMDVSNGAGDSWRLTGDGTLNRRNLDIIQKAVGQSIANINDPGILADNLDFGLYFDKVWKFAPRLNAAGLKSLDAVAREYTTPGSAALISSAAQIIRDQVDVLIQKLEDANALRPA